MPSYNKSASSDPKKTDSSYSPNCDLQSIVADQDSSSKAGKRKTKNAVKQSVYKPDNEDKFQPAEQMGVPNPSILNQLHGFPNNKNTSVDALSDLTSTQKVSDEATPPTDVWSRAHSYGRSPPGEAIPGLSIGGSPTVEPGFSSRANLNLRSPPVSPPLRKARPVSYGGGVPPLPSHPRISTSPYSYSTGAYGSPPALPHLPQQHFYGPQNIDLGLPHATAQQRLPDPVVLRFSPVPGGRLEARDAALLALDGGLSVLSYNGDRMEQVGALHGIQGTIADATFLTWTSGYDPFAEYRPLVALTVHGLAEPEKDAQLPQERAYSGAPEGLHETRVVVYSLAKASQIVELLRVPSQMSVHPGGQSATAVAANLTVHASGNFIAVTSGLSGELYIFTVRKGKESAVFECLGKYWTTIQPQLQRRDSSHSRASDAEVSPADIGRGPEMDDLPIVSLNGRWLAYCPARTPSRSSIGAVLGGLVLHNKNTHISTRTAPSRPLNNCEVDSPDVDTFLSKVAKGFAQEAVKGAKWISEKGMQTWQNYWKRDSPSPGQPASSSSSPPIYSPPMGLVQFPPTHAGDAQNASNEPESVTILDLKLLQENQGRKNLEFTHMTTFQPPGGCSFLSFMPTGLGLMTANRKGDVQYIWDLMQIRYVKLAHLPTDGESVRVRQIARYERLSPSTIIDIAWDGFTGHRFALLTKNKTVHLFDLPNTAFQWPPPRTKKHRAASVPVDPSHAKPETETPPQGGFFASAMSIAGRTQPMFANLRGRAPSMGGIGATGIGLASTTGIKGGRAVAAGLSKSLGAASETVTSIRHANQSRLHLKASARQGTLLWQRRDGKSVLSVLDPSAIKIYYVRMTKPRENRQRETVSVFDARKAVASKFPLASDLMADVLVLQSTPVVKMHGENDQNDESLVSGFWKVRANRDGNQRMPHPLASAEIETNAPYQPFHSDPRVTISVPANDQQLQNLSSLPSSRLPLQSSEQASTTRVKDKWVFGTNIGHMERSTIPPTYPSTDPTGSVIYRETKLAIAGNPTEGAPFQIADEGVSHVVSNTKKKKRKGKAQGLILDEDHDVSGHGPLKQDTHDPDFDLLDQDNQS
ncbi:uncharacterized protein A1O9_04928 [Exophiala aquamarina CBS 119918]|uniref:BCAS3 domain-containing protein n=1 Tax=Exophiala aquamarina CBS 119918 TaxID=1182545 RepID=A0A072PL49_9EURO|nr:uncharacterized protein A1O9_04928 [Exophiala aquamarina CBS 119918]KEF60078.1 hypothetical protein A1O9_04928 [Exophiala aquamarina CBS 119918]